MSEFRLHDWVNGTHADGFLKFEKFVKAIRADLGNSNSELKHGDLIKLFVNDFDTAKLGAIAGKSAAPSEGAEGARETAKSPEAPS
ncbi:hypothetical protein [Sorangium sp. So ce1151]|uniref:hypothetical protein n=1 Tax=Sorangium sp. So ce1151 TaxID=3133332 RepID=UPI003F5DEBFA